MRLLMNKTAVWIMLVIIALQAYILLAWGKIEAVEMVDIQRELDACLVEKSNIFNTASSTIANNNDLVRKYNALVEINKELADACEKYCPGTVKEKQL